MRPCEAERGILKGHQQHVWRADEATPTAAAPGNVQKVEKTYHSDEDKAHTL